MLDSSHDRGNELKVSLLVTLSSLPFLVAVLHHSIHLSFFALAVLPSHLPFVAIINYGEYTASRLEQTAFSFVSLPCKCTVFCSFCFWQLFHRFALQHRWARPLPVIHRPTSFTPIQPEWEPSSFHCCGNILLALWPFCARTRSPSLPGDSLDIRWFNLNKI